MPGTSYISPSRSLEDIGPDAASAVQAVMACLKGEDDVDRSRAADALGAIGPGAKAPVPALIEALRVIQQPVIWKSVTQRQGWPGLEDSTHPTTGVTFRVLQWLSALREATGRRRRDASSVRLRRLRRRACRL